MLLSLLCTCLASHSGTVNSTRFDGCQNFSSESSESDVCGESTIEPGNFEWIGCRGLGRSSSF